jgi:hypothetical protein
MTIIRSELVAWGFARTPLLKPEAAWKWYVKKEVPVEDTAKFWFRTVSLENRVPTGVFEAW